MIKFEELLGKVIVAILMDNNEIIFTIEDGTSFKLYHEQDCCEIVYIESIDGDLNDLIGYPLLQAEKSTNSEDTMDKIKNPESFTWTFYKLATIKGYVSIRWLGESNGYYSESVDFKQII